jgi:hypothetical protein
VALARRWEDKLGRDFDFKLKMDLTPIADQPPSSGGAIPLTRKE